MPAVTALQLKIFALLLAPTVRVEPDPRHGCADHGVSCSGYGSCWRQSRRLYSAGYVGGSGRGRGAGHEGRGPRPAAGAQHPVVPALPPVTEPQLITVAVLPVVVNAGELPRTLAVTVNVFVFDACVAVTPDG